MKVLGIVIILFLVLFINAYGANQTDINSSDETKPVVPINDELKYYSILFTSLVFFIMIYLRYVKVRKTKVESSFDNLQFDELENIANNIQNNVRVLLTIFGILVSFTLTVQIDKIFLDLPFITWISIIFAVIFRGGTYLYNVIESKIKSREEYNYALDHIHRFYFEAMLMLLILLGFTPLLIIKETAGIESIETILIKFAIIVILIITFALLFDILLFKKRSLFYVTIGSLLLAYILSLVFTI